MVHLYEITILWGADIYIFLTSVLSAVYGVSQLLSPSTHSSPQGLLSSQKDKLCLFTRVYQQLYWIAEQFYSSVSSQTVYHSRLQRHVILSLKLKKKKNHSYKGSVNYISDQLGFTAWRITLIYISYTARNIKLTNSRKLWQISSTTHEDFRVFTPVV